MEPGESDVSELEFTPLDPRRAPSPDSQRRAAAARWLRSLQGRVALSALVSVLVAGVLAGMVARVTPDPLGVARAALNLPTPTETAIILPGGDTIAVANTVPWGVLRVDGRPPAFVQARPFGRAFILPRGVHHLVYEARYFDPLRCDFSVPQSPRDTCPVLNAAGVAGELFQRILDMRDSLDRLKDGQYQALVAAVSSAVASISASATIQPGERYYDQNGQTRVATAPMTFTVGLRPLTAQDAYKGQTCALLCASEPDWTNTAAATSWPLSIQSEPTWTVTDASGHGFNSGLPANPGAASATQLAVTLTGSSWSAPLSAADKMSVLSSIVQSAAVVALYNQVWNITATGSTSGSNVAEGALVESQQAQGKYEFWWRFGILYCVTAYTCAAFADIPPASPVGEAQAKQALGSMSA